MRKDIVLCGVGGQGTVLASKLISDAAMAQGIPIMSAETIGMAQRGGSVFSHLRLGEGVYSPMIAEGEADLILAFEPGEAVRCFPYLKEGGTVVVSNRAVMPVTAALSGSSYDGQEMIDYLRRHVENLVVVDTKAALEDLGSAKVLNLLLLGAALYSGTLGFSEEDMKAAIRARLPEKLHELNFRALSYVGEKEKA
ncbi:MAG: indolepyruvate oxidoreductase subunit beta [Blautia sp.]|nr:indolepyruvate oxidoreductase subunit beta [Blautia sp.]